MKNYFTHEGGVTVKLIGFEEIKNFMFVSIPFSKRTVILESKMLPEKENCFKVEVSADRTVTNEHLYYLLDDYKLFQKDFIYNEPLGNYFCI